MSAYDHIVALVAQENPSFEAFYADMCTRIPALKGRGAIEVQPVAFKRALKAAYVAGDYDALQRLLTPDSTSDDEKSSSPS